MARADITNVQEDSLYGATGATGIRGCPLQAMFGQWMQSVLKRRAERIDRRAEWWARWTQRRLP
jgi:hypothetical protein